MDELSLLVWLSRGNKEQLIKLMSSYTGCEEEVYTDNILIRIMENAISNLNGKYHIRNLMCSYFDAKHRWQNYAEFFPKEYTYSEVETLGSVILSIPKKVFDEEDTETLNELRKLYAEVLENE